LQTPRPSRPFPPAQYIPDHDYDTRHIALDLRFDWDKEQAMATETFVFAPLVKDLRVLQLDAAYMTFSSIKLASGTPLKYEFDDKAQKLRISLDRVYQPTDVVTISLAYSTHQPPRGARSINGGGGLTFIKPSADDPTRPKQIWSQGESEYNHFWFPCFDHPNDFFTSEVSAAVPKPLMVVSNGKLLETKENADGTRTFHWKIEAPHASYLTSIIVGEYKAVTGSYAGIPVITNVYPNEFEEGKITAARLPEMVKFFSDVTGIKYPYEKYAQTVARDFNGGMENITATTQYDLMIHDARTELDQTSDSLESHELAHMWFGDYVTCRNWSDIWLNESFATYFQALWNEHSLGHDDFLYLDVKGNKDQYYSAWAQGNRRPIVTKHYANPDAVFDTYAYPRGGAVLHMLRTYLGEENWWRSINHYLNKYAHQPVETAQFRIAIEETTGQSMEWFFDEWLYKMGHPIFRVTQNYDPSAQALKLTVRQEQKPDPDSRYPQVDLFQTPVDIEIGTATNTRVERVRIEPKEEQTFTFRVDSQPLLVNFDYHDTLIKELLFEKTSDQLAYQLSHDQDVLGRVWALQQLSTRLKDQATAEVQKQQIVSQLASALTGDKFWGVRLQAATALNNVPGEVARASLLAALKDQKSVVRARAITSLASSKDPGLASTYQQFLNDPSYLVIKAAALALGQTKSPTAYDPLVKELDVPSWRDTIKVSALVGLGALGDKRVLDVALKYATKGNSLQVRAAAIRLLGIVGKDDPRTFPLVADAVSQALDGGHFTLGFAAVEALTNLGDPRGLPILERLTKDPGPLSQLAPLLVLFQERLRKSAATADKPPEKQP
jgi:aminopeptidase N